MKRTVTIFLLLLFLLQVLGFYGVFLGLKFRFAQEAIRGIDEEHYSGADEMTFAVPLTVPYYTDLNKPYARVDGEFEHDGEVYRLVKQKLYRDTLYVVCIKDRQEKKINQEIADFVKSFTDKPVNAKQQSSGTIQMISKEYVSSLVSVESGHPGWHASMTFITSDAHYAYQGVFKIHYPPKFISFIS